MESAELKKVVLKLVGRNAMAFAFHPEDRSLSVVDRHGRKFLFGWGDYQQYLKAGKGTAPEKPVGRIEVLHG
ncbi:MAG TPA: hypothetical protein VLR89_05850 [Anaerolineaceae bacterium]|nr:hypothetical protein [Anaerolineaceae bacterium]